MAICTYFDESDVKFYKDKLSHPCLREILDELNQKSDDGWFIAEQDVYLFNNIPWWKAWKVPESKHCYTLYHKIHAPEYQIINFYKEDSNTSINLNCSADTIMAYCYGYLGGLEEKGKSNEK